MKKTAQKAVSLLLSLLFLLALVPTASAATNQCRHQYYSKARTGQEGGTAAGCRYVTYTTDTCTLCGYTTESTVERYEPHDNRSYSANCNGRTQTINQSCTICGYHSQKTQRCPNAPHTGECTALPLSVGPEVSVK